MVDCKKVDYFDMTGLSYIFYAPLETARRMVYGSKGAAMLDDIYCSLSYFIVESFGSILSYILSSSFSVVFV